MRRNCSQPETTEKHLENLQQYLENCNYPPHLTQYQINRARPIPRDDLLHKKERPLLERTLFVITYSPATAQLPKILKQCPKTLDESGDLADILSDPPMLAYR